MNWKWLVLYYYSARQKTKAENDPIRMHYISRRGYFQAPSWELPSGFSSLVCFINDRTSTHSGRSSSSSSAPAASPEAPKVPPASAAPFCLPPDCPQIQWISKKVKKHNETKNINSMLDLLYFGKLTLPKRKQNETPLCKPIIYHKGISLCLSTLLIDSAVYINERYLPSLSVHK